MALFGKSSAKEVDTRIAMYFRGTTKGYAAKSYEKHLAENSDAIIAKLDRLHEEPVLVVLDENRNRIAVLTDRRIFTAKKARIEQSFGYDEIAETTIGSFPNDRTMVSIETHSSRLDYAPTDSRRFEKIMQIVVDAPRTGNAICEVIDSRIGGT